MTTRGDCRTAGVKITIKTLGNADLSAFSRVVFILGIEIYAKFKVCF